MTVHCRAGSLDAERHRSASASTFDSGTSCGYPTAIAWSAWCEDFADSAARIEAANDLTLQAGRDVADTGGVLQAGRDLSLAAGRDIVIASAQDQQGQTRGTHSTRSDITQLGASVSAGRDLSAEAGRDISAIASRIDAGRDIAMTATEDLTLSSAADEQHSYSKSKKITAQEDHVSQVATDLEAGSRVTLQAGKDLTAISSRITAGTEAYLVAGDQLNLLAAQDSDYSLYDYKKKGSFGSKKTQRDEVTDVRNVGSEIKTGGDLLLVSGGDQRYQAARLESGEDLTCKVAGR